MTTLSAGALALGVALALAGASRADDLGAGTPEAPLPSPLKFNAFVSTVYSVNDNRPASGTNQLRTFDLDDRRLQVSVAEFVLQKPSAAAGEWGFRLDAVGGSTVPRVAAAAGFFRDDRGVARDFDLQQAFVSFTAPLGRGLRLDAGKFVTHMGYELVEGFDGANDNVTRSLLFGYAIPITHTGLRASYGFSEKLSGQLMLVQGWDNVRDNNGGKSVGLQLAYLPVDGVSLILNTISGREQAGAGSPTRHVADVVATWRVSDALSIGANLDYGREGREASWSGLALYGTLALHPRFSVALRAETFDDADGARTGLVQRVNEITLTPRWTLSKYLALRADLRADRSDAPVFQQGTAFSRDQRTIAFNVLAVY